MGQDVNLPAHCDYWLDIAEGRIAANPQVKRIAELCLVDHIEGPVAEAVRPGDDPDLYGPWVFMPERAERAVRFLQAIELYDDRWAGKSMALMPWQRAVVSELYGWWSEPRPDVRRYRVVRLEVARKNGKSTLGGGLLVYEGRAGAQGGQVLTAATNRVQAEVAYRMAERFVARLPEDVAGNYKITARDGIVWPDRVTSIKSVSREARTILGSNPSAVLFDESSEIADRALIENITTGQKARLNPLEVHITTAARRRDTPWYESVVAWKERLANPDFRLRRELALLYAFESEEDADNEEAWVKAMPALGVTVQPYEIRADFEEAKELPSKKRALLILYGNLYVDDADVWLSAKAWSQCKAERPDESVLKAAPLYLGYDHSATTALSSLALVYDLDGRLWVEFINWLPRQTYDDLLGEAELASVREVMEAAVKSKALRLVDGPIIEEGLIEEEIERLYETRDVAGLGYDPWRCKAMMLRVERTLGREMMVVPQTPARLASPMMAIEKAVLTQALGHEGNPFYSWQMANSHMRDPEKPKIRHPDGAPARRVDSIIAMINAVAVLETAEEPGAGLVDLTDQEIKEAMTGSPA